MSPQRSGIADILITIVTITTQILIARRFFADRKKLPVALSRVLTCLLYVLWAAFVCAIPFRFPALTQAMKWVPPTVRGVLIATGNIWGMTAVASFCIYLVFNFLASRRGTVHSPARRRLIQAAGTVAVAAPFAAAAFGAIIERTRFRVKEIDLPIPNLHPGS